MTQSYPDFRTYGKGPYRVVVVHGGPGAPGEMSPVAQKLSEFVSVLEPLQKQASVTGQVMELKQVLDENCELPVILIGWSWGAMLSIIFASQYSKMIKKLILVNSGPLEKAHADTIMPKRSARFSEKTKLELEKINKSLADPKCVDKNQCLKKFAQIIFQADSYDPIVFESLPIEFQYELHLKVWEEAKFLRESGQLLTYAKTITSPVLVIHGDYDPRPFQGIRDPLSKVLQNFRFVLLKNCGHYPWYEKRAKDSFYKILEEELFF